MSDGGQAAVRPGSCCAALAAANQPPPPGGIRRRIVLRSCSSSCSTSSSSSCSFSYSSLPPQPTCTRKKHMHAHVHTGSSPAQSLTFTSWFFSLCSHPRPQIQPQLPPASPLSFLGLLFAPPKADGLTSFWLGARLFAHRPKLGPELWSDSAHHRLRGRFLPSSHASSSLFSGISCGTHM